MEASLHASPEQGAALVRNAFRAFSANPPDLRQIGDQAGEIRYVQGLLPAYERTVADLLQLFGGAGGVKDMNFVELGAFLGIVSNALARAEAKVVACDIPEFFERQHVRNFYKAMDIETRAFNLRRYELPFERASQDCVIACETFEHLNFNPLPVFAEINRILKPGRYLYVAMPNGAYLLKRLRYLLSGDTPGFTVDDLYAQLDAQRNMVVGLHWKEYSMRQTVQMVTPLGFEVLSARAVNDAGAGSRALHKRLVRVLVPGGDTQVLIFRKTAEFTGSFAVCADS